MRVEGVVGGRVGGGRRPEAKAVSTCDKTLLAAPSLCPLISTNNINGPQKVTKKVKQIGFLLSKLCIACDSNQFYLRAVYMTQFLCLHLSS